MEYSDDADLLYGDLEFTGKDAEVMRLQELVLTERNKQQLLVQEIALLKEQMVCLAKDKAQLEANTVAIYNTAMREIKRKDAEIIELRGRELGNRKNGRL